MIKFFPSFCQECGVRLLAQNHSNLTDEEDFLIEMVCKPCGIYFGIGTQDDLWISYGLYFYSNLPGISYISAFNVFQKNKFTFSIQLTNTSYEDHDFALNKFINYSYYKKLRDNPDLLKVLL